MQLLNHVDTQTVKRFKRYKGYKGPVVYIRYEICNVANAREWYFSKQIISRYCAVAHRRGNINLRFSFSFSQLVPWTMFFSDKFPQSIFQKNENWFHSRRLTISQETFSLRLPSMRKFHLDAIKHPDKAKRWPVGSMETE